VSTLTFSQSKFNLGASFNVNIPVGGFYNIAKTGIGGSILGEYVFSEKISAVISGSFNTYNSTIPNFAVGGSTYDISIIENGKIKEEWAYYNQLYIYEQMGYELELEDEDEEEEDDD